MSVSSLLSRFSPHPAPGYLFFGTRGGSKREIAEHFIRDILQHPAPAPLSAHPDFAELLRPADSEIFPVEVVRDFIKFLHSSSARGSWRIALIDQAERLNTASVNALLKDVEESQHVVYVFITDRIEQMPATLRSRLVHIACPITKQDREEEAAASKTEQALAQDLVRSLSHDQLAQALGTIDRIAKACDAHAESRRAWELVLQQAMQSVFTDATRPIDQQIKISRALTLAWNLIGTSMNPRLGLEYALVEDEETGETPEMLRV